MEDFHKHLAELTQYMTDNGVSTYPLPKVMLNKDPQATNTTLCPTGHYDPQTKVIVLYIHGRHPKDILRSYAHEMIHHDQNLTGKMDVTKLEGANDPMYAQNDKYLRELEEDAFKRGNMVFRDWADNKKYK